MTELGFQNWLAAAGPADHLVRLAFFASGRLAKRHECDPDPAIGDRLADPPGSARRRRRVEALNAESFGPGRFAKSAYRLREGVDAHRVFVFCRRGETEILRGSVRFWPITVGGHEELLLGPLAVQSDQRGRGIGIALMQAGIEAAQQGPWRGILLVGDEPYYAKVGFSRLPPGRVKFPGPVDQNRILGLSLKAGELLTCRAKCAGRRSMSRFVRMELASARFLPSTIRPQGEGVTAISKTSHTLGTAP